MSVYERFEKHEHRTFREAAKRYIDEFTGKDKHRQQLAVSSVLPYIGDLRVIDVDDEAMKQYKHDRFYGEGHFSRPAMKGTVNKEITCVVTVLNRACRVWRWIPSAPQILRVASGPVRKSYPLSWSEQDALFVALPSYWECVAALFAVNTGVRKAELFGLKWADMQAIPELDTFVFILRETKNGQSRAVICNWLARKAVSHMHKAHLELDPEDRSDFVFPARTKNVRIRQSGKVWSQCWVRAGLPRDPIIRKGIHNLRHTFATRLRAAGVEEEDRNCLMGHASTNLAQHYALPDIRRLAKAAELITERSDGIVLRDFTDSGPVYAGHKAAPLPEGISGE